MNRPQNILIYRSDTRVLCELLDKNQFRLLNKLVSGKTLGTALEGFSESSQANPLPVTQWFTNWAAKHLITDTKITNKKKLAVTA